MTIHILTHDDADGIISAYLIYRYYNRDAKVRFQEWHRFGVDEQDVEYYNRQKDIDALYVLDLGATKDTLDNLARIHCTTILIDHHPTDVDLKQYLTPDHRIVHDTNNCTTGLVYRLLQDTADEWVKQWTVIGIVADVATDTPEGARILDDLSKDIHWSKWVTVYWDGKKEGTMPVPAIWGRYLNTARRLAWHRGAEVALKAMNEIEMYGSLDILEDPFSTNRGIHTRELDVDYPYVALLRAWYHEWVSKRDSMYTEEYTKTYDFPTFRLAITNHPWDVAGWLAMVKATKEKPCWCINYGSPHSQKASLSGRAEEGHDLLKHVVLLREKLGDKIYLGGHSRAVGGWISKSLSPQEVLQAFGEALAPEATLLTGSNE